MLKDQLDKEHRKFFQLLFVRRRERNSPLELTTGRGHTRSVFLEADRQTDTSLSLSLSLSRTHEEEETQEKPSFPFYSSYLVEGYQSIRGHHLVV